MPPAPLSPCRQPAHQRSHEGDPWPLMRLVSSGTVLHGKLRRER